MVQVNNEKKEITLVTNGTVEDLHAMQLAIIELIAWQDRNVEINHDTLRAATDILLMLLPSYEQQKRGFVDEADYMEFPENINPKQREKIKEAFFFMRTGNTYRGEKNTVLEALQSIEG